MQNCVFHEDPVVNQTKNSNNFEIFNSQVKQMLVKLFLLGVSTILDVETNKSILY